MRRWALALIIGSATPILTAQAPPIPGIELSARNDAVRDRMDAAARLAVPSYREWLGSPPFDRVAVRDSGTADSPGQMLVESHVAKEIARAWLARVAGNDAWKDGAAEYLQSRIVEQLFDRRYFLKAYRYEGDCWFGCHVPWSYRSLPLSRWAVISFSSAHGAFASLERELGWPTLQGALRIAASSGTDPVAAMSEAIGRDLTPVFQAAATGDALRGAPWIDHAIGDVSSIPASCPTPCYRTEVAILSGGPVPFPLTVRVSFADGKIIAARWDGRRNRLEFESATPAVAAHLDPDRVFLLDRNPLNNARVPPRETNVPVTKWMARWIVWLQDAMLTHTFPV